jgi:hypothetical protein
MCPLVLFDGALSVRSRRDTNKARSFSPLVLPSSAREGSFFERGYCRCDDCGGYVEARKQVAGKDVITCKGGRKKQALLKLIEALPTLARPLLLKSSTKPQ